MKLIVTAGGQGTKLWPYSRESQPKQFQPILGDRSLYAYTIETLLKSFSAEDIFISTKRKFIKYVSEQSPQIALKNYIIEPDIAKDRGPAEGLAFAKMAHLFPEEPFFLVQADCVRKPEDNFLQMIADAEKLIRSDKKFVTGGLKATEPNLGVDYLKLGERVPTNTQQEVYSVAEYVPRKSSYQETKELIESFHIVIHCNHACWYPELMLNAYKQHRPDWYEGLVKMKEVFDKPGEDAAIEKIYAEMEKGPTELVTSNIMDEANIILLNFKWTDIGTWGSLYEFFATPGEVYKDGKVVYVDSENSLIKSSDENKLIALAGVDNLVVVDTKDALLIIRKDKLDKLKELQSLLKGGDYSQYV